MADVCNEHYIYTGAEKQPTYICWAAPGTPKSTAKWRIMKCIYDGSNRLVDRIYANQTAGFVHKATEAASYNYDY